MDLAGLDELLERPGPARGRGAVRLGEMPGGSAVDVPFTVVRGARPGPTIWIMAARDGDEVHASLVALQLQRDVTPDALAGTLVVMPIGNVPGFGVLSREHPLAPTYLEEQMDDRFFDIISARGGSFVDLHSAGVPSPSFGPRRVSVTRCADWEAFRSPSNRVPRPASCAGSAS